MRFLIFPISIFSDLIYLNVKFEGIIWRPQQCGLLETDTTRYIKEILLQDIPVSYPDNLQYFAFTHALARGSTIGHRLPMTKKF